MAHTWYIITGVMTASDSKELIHQSFTIGTKAMKGIWEGEKTIKLIFPVQST